MKPKPITLLPDPEPGTPGPFYVSAIDGETFWLLAGPFATHAEALAQVDAVRELSHAQEPRSYWYQFGTCRIDVQLVGAEHIKRDCPANKPLGITPMKLPE